MKEKKKEKKKKKETKNKEEKICGICKKKISESGDYCIVQAYYNGKHKSKGIYHIQCFRNKFLQTKDIDSLIEKAHMAFDSLINYTEEY